MYERIFAHICPYLPKVSRISPFSSFPLRASNGMNPTLTHNPLGTRNITKLLQDFEFFIQSKAVVILMDATQFIRNFFCGLILLRYSQRPKLNFAYATIFLSVRGRRTAARHRFFFSPANIFSIMRLCAVCFCIIHTNGKVKKTKIQLRKKLPLFFSTHFV